MQIRPGKLVRVCLLLLTVMATVGFGRESKAEIIPTLLWGQENIILDSYRPIAVSNGAGGAFFLRGEPPSNPDFPYIDEILLAQHVDANGMVLWDKGGIRIAARDDYVCVSKMLVPDQVGGVMLFWTENAGGSVCHVYAQRIDAFGRKKWDSRGILLTDSGPHVIDDGLRIVEDGEGGAVVVWHSSPFEGRIRAQRIDAEGTLLWGPEAALVHDAGHNHLLYSRVIRNEQGGFIVTWLTSLYYPVHLLAQKLDTNGQRLWPAEGIDVSLGGTKYGQSFFDMTADGQGGVFLVWVPYDRPPDGLEAIRGQRLNQAGEPLWSPGGVQVAVSKKRFMDSVALTPDLEGGVLLLWNALSVYGQRLTADGIPLWSPEGAAISPYPAWNDQNVSDGSGGAIVVWGSSRPEGPGVAIQRIDKDGNLVWPPEGQDILVAPGGNSIYSPQIVSDDAGGAIAFSPNWNLPYGTSANRVSDRITTLPTRTLKVTKTGAGSGKVNSSPVGIDCGDDCWDWYEPGTSVQLIATPVEGSAFLAWSGDPDCVDGEITINANTICTARFELLTPNIVISPVTKDFGDVDVAQSSTQTFALTNVGLVDLVIGSLSIQGTDAGNFLLSSDGCSLINLPPDRTCEFDVIFQPRSGGSKQAVVVVPSNDPDEPSKQVAISGTGLLQEIDVSPTVLDFGILPLGGTYRRYLTVRNIGNKDLILSGISSPSTPFGRLEEGCATGSVLGPGEQCFITITLTLQEKGSFRSSITVQSDDPNTPESMIQLEGRSGPDFHVSWDDLFWACRNTSRGVRCKLTGLLFIENDGTENALRSSIFFYLSTDHLLHTNDILLKKVSIGTVYTDRPIVKKISFRLPPGKLGEIKYIIAVLDATDKVKEADEGNNVRIIREVVYLPE